jgi:dTDP-4-amino-4,6-dideoxygalactose transaminase
LDAFDSNWLAPMGPHVDAFERELADRVGVSHAAALSSGTAALHLALQLVGVGAGDTVIVPTLTFVATANAVRYVGAEPVFVDADPKTWCLDVNLLREVVQSMRRRRQGPAAVVSVDLFGGCPEYEELAALCDEFQLPLIEDAAEALGSTYKGKPAGSFGVCAAFSFNGNKIITTSGGGMLVSESAELVDRARWLASQAREQAAHYEHVELGYNYRLSNLLAAVGRGQLRTLDTKLALRRQVHERYRYGLGDLRGVHFMPVGDAVTPNHWLTCITLEDTESGAGPEDVRLALEADDVESRPIWKPLHLQPLYRDAMTAGGTVAENLFSRGLCLPSGSALTREDQDRIISITADVLTARRPS